VGRMEKEMEMGKGKGGWLEMEEVERLVSWKM
jgi:hypothetical protein